MARSALAIALFALSASTAALRPGSGSDDADASNQGHWDALERRRLQMSTEFFFVPTSPTTPAAAESATTPSAPAVVRTRCVACDDAAGHAGDAAPSLFRDEAWVVPALALSALTMLMIAAFEIFVLCKACQTIPSRRHLFLGQMLLLGLFSAASLASVVAMTPTPSTCAVVRFGTGLSYALIFASLLVKSVFLISLNGGVYLPAPYQGLLLFFAVLVQVGIGVQWLATSPPAVADLPETPVVDSAGRSPAGPASPSSPESTRRHTEKTVHQHRPTIVTASDLRDASTAAAVPSGTHQAAAPGAVVETSSAAVVVCQTPYADALLSLTYVAFLIVFVAVLAFKSRAIRDNYREATYIGLSVACSVPAWLAWTLCGFAVGDRHRDACVAFGLVACSALVFLIMFMPKGRQLAAMGKEGLYVEDRDDGVGGGAFSSLSRTGSGYSPSFFHFKPVKYSGESAVPGLGGTHKSRHHTITTAGGDALCYRPAPPSYSRIFHCYPNLPGYLPPHFMPGSIFVRSDDGNVYTTLEPTLSSNPNVYFQRGTGVHPGMMY